MLFYSHTQVLRLLRKALLTATDALAALASNNRAALQYIVCVARLADRVRDDDDDDDGDAVKLEDSVKHELQDDEDNSVDADVHNDDNDNNNDNDDNNNDSNDIDNNDDDANAWLVSTASSTTTSERLAWQSKMSAALAHFGAGDGRTNATSSETASTKQQQTPQQQQKQQKRQKQKPKPKQKQQQQQQRQQDNKQSGGKKRAKTDAN